VQRPHIFGILRLGCARIPLNLKPEVEAGLLAESRVAGCRLKGTSNNSSKSGFSAQAIKAARPKAAESSGRMGFWYTAQAPCPLISSMMPSVVFVTNAPGIFQATSLEAFLLSST
jgi:hypothetical protein